MPKHRNDRAERAAQARENVRESLAILERTARSAPPRSRLPYEVTGLAKPETEAGLAGHCFRRVCEILDGKRSPRR